MSSKKILRAVAGLTAAMIAATPISTELFRLPINSLSVTAKADVEEEIEKYKFNVRAGDFTLLSNEELVANTDYRYFLSGDTKKVTVLSNKPIVFTHTSDIYGKITTTIEVAKDVNANITLANVESDLSQWDNRPAFVIEDGSKGNVTLTLEGDNYLKSGNYCAGLQKSGSDRSVGTLTIKGSGTLTAIGGDRSAGIGGGCGTFMRDGSTSKIEFIDCTVTAIGGANAAGIGGGDGYDASKIRIANAKVDAKAGPGCPNDIGGGCGKDAIPIIGENGADFYLFKLRTNEKVLINGVECEKTIDGYVYEYVQNGTLHYPVTITIGNDTNGYIYDIPSKKWLIVTTPTVTPAKNLKFTNKNQVLILSSSTPVKDATVVYSDSKDGTYTQNRPVGKKAGTYTIWYKVQGDDKYAETEPQSVTVKITDAAKPNVKAKSTKNSVTLSWKAIPSTSRYAVYKVVNGTFVKVKETKDTSFKITGLKAGKTYKYAVRALTGGKWTSLEKSDIITVKTKTK